MVVVEMIYSPLGVRMLSKPEIVLVSAGFDAHERDPLGGMRLTTAAFAAIPAFFLEGDLQYTAVAGIVLSMLLISLLLAGGAG